MTPDDAKGLSKSVMLTRLANDLKIVSRFLWTDRDVLQRIDLLDATEYAELIGRMERLAARLRRQAREQTMPEGERITPTPSR